jgi:ketosteroid isomerase-like protein
MGNGPAWSQTMQRRVATTDRNVASLTFRDGKIARYREFYDEAAARAAVE